MAYIKSIVNQPKEQEYEDGRFDYFIRVPVQSANLIAGHGIKGDRKAGRNRKRQLNLLSDDWLAERAAEGYKAAPGEFGEQLIIGGLQVLDLQPGDVLQLGSAAQIEINKPRTGCSRLMAAQGHDGQWPGGFIGVLATVITSGVIHVEDEVLVIGKPKSVSRKPKSVIGDR
jgi:MOSC domain-containing protein YiiM